MSEIQHEPENPQFKEGYYVGLIWSANLFRETYRLLNNQETISVKILRDMEHKIKISAKMSQKDLDIEIKEENSLRKLEPRRSTHINPFRDDPEKP